MGALELRLACRAPFDGEALIGFLAARAIPGVESVEGLTYRRSIDLPGGGAVVELTPEPLDGVLCRLWLDDPGDRDAAVARCRRLLDLDADPAAVAAHLEPDPVLGELVRRRPGLRVPGCAGGFELAVRAIVGQQVSVAGARTILGRLAARYGGAPGRFPGPAVLAEVDPGRSRSRAPAARPCASSPGWRPAASSTSTPGADPQATRSRLLGIRGIGPWTAEYIAMRALGDPDAWLPGDVGVRHALERLGQPPGEPAALKLAEAWRPWRSYAVMHLWAGL